MKCLLTCIAEDGEAQGADDGANLHGKRSRDYVVPSLEPTLKKVRLALELSRNSSPLTRSACFWLFTIPAHLLQ